MTERELCHCDEGEDPDGHEHCPKCDCILTWLEGELCQSCARTMSIMGRLMGIYEKFNSYHGLDLGSADEHLYDDDLTGQQKAWLQRFCTTWDRANRRPNAWKEG